MPELTWGPAPYPEVHCRSCKGMLPTSVSPGLYLAEWTRQIADLSYYIAAYMGHSYGSKLQFVSQMVRLADDAQGELLYFHQVIQWLARYHELRKSWKKTTNPVICRKLSLFQHFTDMSIRSSRRLLLSSVCTNVSNKYKQTCPSWLEDLPHGQKCTTVAARECLQHA